MKKILAFVLLMIPATAVVGQDGHYLIDRWNSTELSGGGLQMGDPTTITWGYMADGALIAGNNGEPQSGSNLQATLDAQFGAGNWHDLFVDSFDRWSELSGNTYVFEGFSDGGAILDRSADPVGGADYSDVRIGGHFIDGNSGVLAYNFFPDHGDMVIDTADADEDGNFLTNPANDFRAFRNVIMHEHGHGLGMAHPISVSSERWLMNPRASTAFDGPQFLDILAIQRGYGDVYEKSNGGAGNDEFGNATDLGIIFDGNSAILGSDAADAVVARTDTDFISIDGTTDQDFISFTINEGGAVDIVLTPMGPTYEIRPQSGGFNEVIDASALNDLSLELYDTDGISLLASSNVGAAGVAESILNQSLTSGTYFIRVFGAAERAQFYEISASFTSVPEPGSAALIAFAGLGLFLRRKRN